MKNVMGRVVAGVITMVGLVGVSGAAQAATIVAPSGSGQVVGAVASDGTYLWTVNEPSSSTGTSASLTRTDIATGTSATQSFTTTAGYTSYSVVSTGSTVVVLGGNGTSSTAWSFPTTLATPAQSTLTSSALALYGTYVLAASPNSNQLKVYSTSNGTFNSSPVATWTLPNYSGGVVDPLSLAVDAANGGSELWVTIAGTNDLLRYTGLNPTAPNLVLSNSYPLYASTNATNPVDPSSITSNGSDLYMTSSVSGQTNSIYEFGLNGAYVGSSTPVGTDVVSSVASDANHVWFLDSTAGAVGLLGAPGAVTNLSVALPAPTSVTLTWTAPSATGTDVTSYLVQYSSDGGTTWVTAPANDISGTTAVLTNIPSPSSDLFRVAALNGLVPSPYSNAVFTQISSPSAPLGVAARAGSGAVTVTWTAPTSTGGLPLTGYVIQASTNAGQSWSAVAGSPVAASATSLTVSGLANGISYQFRVAAENALGLSPYLSAPAVIPSTVPLAPQGLSGSASAPGSVTLTWSPPLSSGGLTVLYYDVQYSSTGGATWVAAGTPVGSATSDTVTGLVNGVGYLFRVAAVSNTGAGPFAVLSNLITPLGAPSAPQAVGATMSVATRATVFWKAPLTNGGLPVTGWIVQYSSTKGASWVTAIASVPSSATSQAVSGLVAGQHYLFRVAAFNYAGQGAYSSAVTPISLPSAPRNVVGVSSSPTSITLAWVSPSYTGGVPLTGYVISRSSNGGKSWAVISRVSGTTVSLVVKGLSVGTGYQFEVAAVDPAGQGAPGRSSTITPVGPPAAPRGISASSVGSRSALVRWTSPSSTGGSVIQYYVLQASSTGGKTWTVINGAISTVAYSYTVTGLVNGARYLFRVAAVNAAGQGAFVTTPALVPVGSPSAPQSVSASEVNGSLQVRWRAPSTSGGSSLTHYVVQASPTNGKTWRGIATVSGTTLSLTTTRLASGVAYLFRVAALNSVGASPFANTTMPVTYLASPSLVRGLHVVVKNSGRVEVAWTPPAASGGTAIAGYLVRYSATNGSTWIPVTPSTGITSTRYVFNGLLVNHTYVVDVAALNATGEGAFSGPLRFVTTPATRTVSWILPLAGFPGRSSNLVVTPAQRRSLVNDLRDLTRRGIRHVTLEVYAPNQMAPRVAHALADLRGVRVATYLTQLARVSRLGGFSVGVLVMKERPNSSANLPAYRVMRVTYLVRA